MSKQMIFKIEVDDEVTSQDIENILENITVVEDVELLEEYED